ncbi:hypothetical protein J2S10_002696 [Neobacillus ginsengisoli]|uniref:Spore protein YkvP/CgeB glycosyl transferase-like domain-containing protein n=1 Tax=Neobacillus ginsengisoli TaxID=904295 RepID=A0ABT9XX55_9BACI|nr:hypothetical protein [Neobacillus ginsengisoli]
MHDWGGHGIKQLKHSQKSWSISNKKAILGDYHKAYSHIEIAQSFCPKHELILKNKYLFFSKSQIHAVNLEKIFLYCQKVYEILGSGGFLITSNTPGVKKLFQPGEDLIVIQTLLDEGIL